MKYQGVAVGLRLSKIPQMKILYVGQAKGTSGYRADALRRLGHAVHVVDPSSYLPNWPQMERWCVRTGFAGVAAFMEAGVGSAIDGQCYDLGWVDSGEHISPKLLNRMRQRCARIVNYNHDDPFGDRDYMRWRQYLNCVKIYDLLVVVRIENVAEARAAGARDVMRVYRTADERAHRRRDLTEGESEHWASDVAFVGTWMPERGPLVARLVDRNVPLTIYGNGWHRAQEKSQISKSWRGHSVDGEEEYVRAVQCAKVCLGLVSVGNRDLHTTRSLEIPSIGSVFLAQRTSEHLGLYKEGVEAEFWADADECADKCLALLADPDRLARIAAAGHRRAVANQNFNEPMLASVLERLYAGRSRAGGELGR